MKKAILSGGCAIFLLVAFSQIAVPQAEAPTWNVGESWGLGAKDVDLTAALSQLMENMESMMPGTSFQIPTARMSFYTLQEVVGQDSQYYNVSVNEGDELTMDMTFNSSYQGQSVSGSMHIDMVMKMNGTIYYSKDSLSPARFNGTMSMQMTFSGSGSGMGTSATNVNGSMDVSGNVDVTYNPSVNLFDFPISVGDNWTVNSTATMTGSLSGKMSVAGLENNVQVPMNSTTDVSMSASCQGTKTITLPDGTSTTAYKIVYSGTKIGDLNLLPARTVYYSPDKHHIVSEEFSFTDAMSGLSKAIPSQGASYTLGLSGLQSDQILFTAEPMSKEAVTAAISGLGTGGGSNTLLIVVAAVVVVIVAVLASVFVILRRRTHPAFQL